MDILPVTGDPWHKVINNPFLVPSPLLATLSALPAVLGHRMILSCVHRAERQEMVIPLGAEEEQEQKNGLFRLGEQPEPGVRLPCSCGKPAATSGF